MSLTAKQGPGMEQIEQGNHHGVCVAVIDLGTQYNQIFNKEQPKVMITWELPDFPLEGENDITFRLISKEYTAVLHAKSNLSIDLVSWRGKQFAPEELEGFDIKTVLGANCLVNVVHNDKGYANVAAVARLPKGMTKRVATYALMYDMDEGVMAIPPNVPEWIEKKIKASKEYIAASGGQAEPPDPSEGQVPVDDEDLPF